MFLLIGAINARRGHYDVLKCLWIAMQLSWFTVTAAAVVILICGWIGNKVFPFCLFSVYISYSLSGIYVSSENQSRET